MKAVMVMFGGLLVICPVGFILIDRAINGHETPWPFCVIYVLTVVGWAAWLQKLEPL